MPFFSAMKDQFAGTRESWRIYWALYGGWKALFGSTYFIIAVVFTMLCYPIWYSQREAWAWFDLCNAVLPNMLGFTLGGYAILLAFGNSKFMEMIAGDSTPGSKNPSPFMKINATFLHFIIIQVLALLTSVFSLAWDIRSGKFAFIGFLLFSYAISVAIAAAFAILRLARWYDCYITMNRKNDHPK